MVRKGIISGLLYIIVLILWIIVDNGFDATYLTPMFLWLAWSVGFWKEDF